MQDKVVIVTGANSGIGRVTARELAKMGPTVVMVCRSQERGAEALAHVKKESNNPNVHLMLCDFSSQQSIESFATQFKADFDRLDVLVNNAGTIFNERLESVDGLEMTLAVNHMGYFILTHHLLDLLKATVLSRIVNVSSMAHQVDKGVNFDDIQRKNGYSAFQVYGESKLMNLMFTYALDRRLAGMNVTVNALHPGFVRTNFGRNTMGLLGKIIAPAAMLFGVNDKEGAKTQIYLATSPEVEGVSGQYWVKSKQTESSAHSHDEAAQERLWELSLAFMNRETTS
ncbi:MAG: SDR family oxidoreductase [Chloroflexota bacterium]